MSSLTPSSLSRASGRTLTTQSKNSSHDSLTSHPLLSPPPIRTSPDASASSGTGPTGPLSTNPGSNVASSTTSTTIVTPGALNASPTTAVNVSIVPASTGNVAAGATLSASPKYTPYVPRHRPTPSQISTSQVSVSQVTAQTSSPSTLNTSSGVTPQLQLQNLKAAAQEAGLALNSLGWAMCEKLWNEGSSNEWEEIWKAVVEHKATLLLPMDSTLPGEQITPDILRDHLIYTSSSALLTHSGLRGLLNPQSLTLRSILSPVQLSTTLSAIQTPASRNSTLSSLPPLPSPLIVPLKPEYPIFNIPYPLCTLPFPTSPLVKPTPRPVLSTPRLNPFASLFGAKPSPAATTIPLPSTPKSDKGDGEGEEGRGTVEVPVYIIQGRIIRRDVIKGINNALKAELREALTGLPGWSVERALAFTASLCPQLPPDPKAKKAVQRQPSTAVKTASVEPDMTDSTTASESFQAFYESLEEELIANEGNEGEEKKGDDIKAEEKRYAILERVETGVCALFYDQLFRQKNSDDASHDEALASRIAALNMLDLGLEHLGIDVGDAKEGVQNVVAEVGEFLQRLQDPSTLSPGDKSSIIVAAHNMAVEGLSRLPPIRLKPEEEIDADPTPIAPTFKHAPKPPNEEDNLVLKSPEGPLGSVERRLQEVAQHGTGVPPVPLSKEEVQEGVQGEGKDTFPEDEMIRSPDSNVSPAAVSPLYSPDQPPTSSLQPFSRPAVQPKSASQPLPVSPNPVLKTPVASDVLLPFMIYTVVRSNPPSFVSHLLYIQRYRLHLHRTHNSNSGAESFSLINLLAVVEFLENVDLAALGLQGVEKVDVGALSPLPLPQGTEEAGGVAGVLGAAERLRRGVNAQVEEFAGSMDKVISGVVDSSFSALRGLLSTPNPEAVNPLSPGAVTVVPPEAEKEAGSPTTPWAYQRFGLLKRGTEFTLASVAALPTLHRVGTRGSTKTGNEEEGRMLVEVPSRPESIKADRYSDGEEESGSEEEEEEEHLEDAEEENEGGLFGKLKSDVRSVKSFGSMMSGESRERRFFGVGSGALGGKERPSLSDRLASVSVRGRLKDASSIHAQSPPSRRLSLLNPVPAQNFSSRPSSPLLKIPPPNERFLNIDPGELKLGEVNELIGEYRRVVEALRAMGGFEEP